MLQQGDGLYGSMIVRGQQDDPAKEIIFLISARPSTSLSEFIGLEPPVAQELLLNGLVKLFFLFL